MISGRAHGDDLSRLLSSGADDFLTKPFTLVQLRARVQSALRLKAAQDRAEHLNRQLFTVNAELERMLGEKDGELFDARGALVLAMAKLVERKSHETGPHLLRMKTFVRILAEAASRHPAFASRLDESFRRNLEDAAPLHDIGKVGVPDHILNKPDKLTDDERLEMQKHTLHGAETLAAVAASYHFATGFLTMAIDIARSHHEHFDGHGYPDGLSGEDIPLAARILTIADVYDAMRSIRSYKNPFSHHEVVHHIQSLAHSKFDPALIDVFLSVADEFETAYSN
jgi:response regulator RpfG family c-di-GMP phosphodiesterase